MVVGLDSLQFLGWIALSHNHAHSPISCSLAEMVEQDFYEIMVERMNEAVLGAAAAAQLGHGVNPWAATANQGVTSKAAGAPPTGGATAPPPTARVWGQAQEHQPPQAQEHQPPQAQEHQPPQQAPQAQEHELPQAQEHQLPQAQEHQPPQAQEHQQPQAQEHQPQPQQHQLPEPQEHQLPQPQEEKQHQQQIQQPQEVSALHPGTTQEQARDQEEGGAQRSHPFLQPQQQTQERGQSGAGMTQPGLVGVSPGMEDGTKDGIKMAAAQEVGEQEETRDKIYHGQKRFLVADQYVFIDLLYFFTTKKNKQTTIPFAQES